jgi:hypothetical protein
VGFFTSKLHAYEIINELVFPLSPAGLFRAKGRLTLQSAQQTFPLICLLIKAVSQSVVAPQPIESLFPTEANSNEAAELAALFNRYGGDKSSAHDYHLMYAETKARRSIALA